MSVYDDHCKTAADVWEAVARVRLFRRSMIPRPTPVIATPAIAAKPTPPPPPKPVLPGAVLIQTPQPLPVLSDVRRIPIRAIVAATCHYFDRPETAIFTGQRLQNAVFMRHVCMHVAVKMTHLSFPDIAYRLIKGDHTTVFHADAKVAAQLKAGHAETVAAVNGIVGALRAAFPNAEEPPVRTRWYGRQYSAKDIEYIRRRWTEDGALVREIAQELDRARGGVWVKIKKLGLDKMSKATSTQICGNPECGCEFQRSESHRRFCCGECCRRARSIRDRKQSPS